MEPIPTKLLAVIVLVIIFAIIWTFLFIVQGIMEIKTSVLQEQNSKVYKKINNNQSGPRVFSTDYAVQIGHTKPFTNYQKGSLNLTRLKIDLIGK